MNHDSVTSAGSLRRDRVLSFAVAIPVASGVCGALLVSVVSGRENVLWHESLAASLALIGGLAVVTAASAAVIGGGRVVLTTAIATILTASSYAATQTVSYRVETSDYRAAQHASKKWPTVFRENFDHVSWSDGPPSQSTFGVGTSSVKNGRDVVAIDSERDMTLLVSPGPETPAVRQFMVGVDMEYLQGPEDGYCVLIFGFERSEHWYGVAIDRTKIEITQDRGGLPHHVLAGPVTSPYLRPNASNHVAVRNANGRVDVFVNGRNVESLRVAVPPGQIWIAPQAKSTPDVVRCSFDNLVVRGIKA